MKALKAMVKSSGKTATSKTKSNMGSKNPIGPQTKKEAKVKTVPPYTQSQSVEVKAEKKKSRLKSAATLVGVIGTAVGSVLADARLNRGADRVRGNNNIKVSAKDAWRAGRNKKSTKK
tara:strand:+ start:431 stop:784 length:354 start_codon:yes stop_codon:yes gene_type:complete